MIKILLNGEWVEGNPSAGEAYRVYDSRGGFILKQKPDKNNKIVVTSHSGRAIVMQGKDLTVDIEMHDSKGNLLDITDNFAIPVGKVGAGNYTTLLLQFINGKATRSYTWNDAGEFEITQDMINMHLDESSKFDFKGFNITVAG